jgi:hypothetical protein
MNLKEKILELKKIQEKKKIKMMKSESHNTITFVALEPGVPDNNNEVASKDEVVKACHQFMINMQNE